MRRLPALFFLVAIPVTLVALLDSPALAAPPLNGTWLVSQEVELPGGEAGVYAASPDAIPFVDVMHLDGNGEIRDVSGVFHESGCGKVLSTFEGARLTVPFNASVGVGDWSAGRDWSVKLSYLHFLYDCSGKPMGYAWVFRAGSPAYELAPGRRAEEEGDDPGKNRDEMEFVGWNGRTTVKFFDLNGAPLPLPLAGEGSSVSEVSGSFRAVRVSGEPAR